MEHIRQENPSDPDACIAMGLNLNYKQLCFRLDRISDRASRINFLHRQHYYYPPRIFTELYRALTAENAFIRSVYCGAFKATGIMPMVDGVVGSLSYGMATLTFNSDVDGVVITDGATTKQKDAFDLHLKERGVSSNVRIFSIHELLHMPFSDRVVALMQLNNGECIAGDNSRRGSTSLTVLHSIPLAEFSDCREGVFDALNTQDREPINRYLHRTEDYLFRLTTFATVYQNNPKLFTGLSI